MAGVLMKSRISLQAMLCIALSCSAFGGEASTTDLIRQRGLVSLGNTARLQAVIEKARRGEPITVAAIGGSITAGGAATKDAKNRYVNRLAAWFAKNFPKAKVRAVNAGIGGTNSYYGAMRLQADVLVHKPDLVVVEYAVNNMSDRGFAESYEGVLRQILRDPQKIAVIELFFMHKDGENAQTWQEMLGRHYQLPMVSFRDAWWPEFTAGRAAWEDLYADVVHPNDTGHILASELLIAVLEQVNGQRSSGQPAPEPQLPSPAISELFADCAFSQYQALKPAQQSGWSQSADGKRWESAATGSSIEFDFTGRVLFLGFDVDKGFGSRVTFSVDRGAPQALKPDAHRRPLARDLAPGKHRLRIEVSGAPAAGAPTDKIHIWAIGSAGFAQ
jgi:lysophospholipase L1-like esterase